MPPRAVVAAILAATVITLMVITLGLVAGVVLVRQPCPRRRAAGVACLLASPVLLGLLVHLLRL